MSVPDLNEALQSPEGAFLERKPDSVNARELRRTLVAFANSVPPGQSAVLLIGVEDNGTVSGISNADSLQKRIRDVAEQDCYPPIAYECRVLSAEGQNVLAVVVHHSRLRPHFAGPAYVRRGSESVAATTDVYERLIHSRTDKCGRILQWKDQIVSVVTVQHVLGKIKVVADVHHKQECECRILDCDSHTLRLELISDGQRVTEPLERVTISYDEQKWRPLLIIRGSMR